MASRARQAATSEGASGLEQVLEHGSAVGLTGHDPHCAWQRHRQIASDGAIVVRPDWFIAWRSPAAASDPRAVLTAVLSQTPWAQTVCSAKVGRFLTGVGAAQR